MKVPDKIYTDNRGVYAELPIFSQADANVEYIRKDALMEWLRKEYETVSWVSRYDEKMRHVTGCVGDTSSSGKAQAYQAVIDKLNSM